MAIKQTVSKDHISETRLVAPTCLRPADHPRARRAGLLQMMVQDTNELILEVGPYHSPVVRGDNVRYFDIFSTKELKQRASQDRNPKVTPDTVPDIHYHDPNGDLSTIPDKFDIIFSSHCLEHQPDLIGHLNQVYGLLNPGGQYFICAPDKRYCFDHYRPTSTLGEVVEAHSEKRTRHSLKSLIDQSAYTTHNDATRHHKGDHLDATRTLLLAGQAKAALNRSREAGSVYRDCHAWLFTPLTFSEIIEAAVAIDLLQLRPLLVCETPVGSVEFTALLHRPFVR